MKTSSKLLRLFGTLFGCLATILAAGQVFGQNLYSQSFDVDDTANWTINPGNVDFTTGQPPEVDTATDIFFDYSTMGIPSAPNSTGGTTRGMRLQANIAAIVFGGYTVSPTGQSFTGDYSVKADVWQNYIGTFQDDLHPVGGVGVSATGASMLSQMGIMSAPDFSNSPGFIEGVLFSCTGDGGSSADYRIYAEERAISYQLPPNTDINGDGIPDSMDSNGQPIDGHATYATASRNNTDAYYTTAFPGGAVVPEGQTTAYPDTQYGMTPAGALGFAWHRWEIKKQNGIVTWLVDGTLLGTVDLTKWDVQPEGTDITFGHADINSGISNDPNYPATMFTLVDNITVDAVAASPAGDFNGDGKVDGADFEIWQVNNGTPAPNGTVATGDANGDMAVNDLDLGVWNTNFGTGYPTRGGRGQRRPRACHVVLGRCGRAGAGGRDLPAPPGRVADCRPLNSPSMDRELLHLHRKAAASSSLICTPVLRKDLSNEFDQIVLMPRGDLARPLRCLRSQRSPAVLSEFRRRRHRQLDRQRSRPERYHGRFQLRLLCHWGSGGPRRRYHPRPENDRQQ